MKTKDKILIKVRKIDEIDMGNPDLSLSHTHTLTSAHVHIHVHVHALHTRAYKATMSLLFSCRNFLWLRPFRPMIHFGTNILFIVLKAQLFVYSSCTPSICDLQPRESVRAVVNNSHHVLPFQSLVFG